jgi:hypothetical protein
VERDASLGGRERRCEASGERRDRAVRDAEEHHALAGEILERADRRSAPSDSFRERARARARARPHTYAHARRRERARERRGDGSGPEDRDAPRPRLPGASVPHAHSL